MEDLPFGYKTCDIESFPFWVQFKTAGYPRKLRREWDSAGAEETIAIVLRYVEAWSITDLDGAPVDLVLARAQSLDRANTSTRANSVDLPIAERNKAKRELAALPDPLGNVEDGVVTWLVRAFVEFWLRELIQPRKNSSPPSIKAS